MLENTVTATIKDKHIGLITIAKEEVHNAFDDKVIAALINAINELEKQDSIRAIVLQATGKFFSAGADLNWMKASANMNASCNLEQAQQLALLMQTLNNCAKPTIAKIQGSAFGGAVGLIACCDIAICVDHAEFSLSEVKLGLIPAVISPYVVAAIGERMARRYFITAEKFSALKAQQMGLIHEVTLPVELETTCNSILQAILQNGPNAVTAAKKLVRQVSSNEISKETIELTAKLIAEIRTSDEAKKGLTAFLQKQKPGWNT